MMRPLTELGFGWPGKVLVTESGLYFESTAVPAGVVGKKRRKTRHKFIWRLTVCFFVRDGPIRVGKTRV
jgi:hypothetical protein